MNKKILLLSAAALTWGGLIINPQSTSAYQGDPSIQGPNYTAERHEAMEKAFDSNDYNAWKTLMNGRGRVSQVITSENFSRFAQAHKLSEAGKIEEAKKIRQGLGLGLGNRQGNRAGGNYGQKGQKLTI